jgi:hypothetical protein
MPRFFFHVFDDFVVRDDEGLELADAEAAHREALAGARAMICEQVSKGRITLSHHLDVEDEEGRRVLSLTFGEAIRIER